MVPAYVAEGAIVPFRKQEIRISFYRSAENLDIDAGDIARTLKSDPSVKAVLAIHYFGYVQDLKAVKELCKARGVLLFEDCAHALFSRCPGGETVGFQGDISFYSFPKITPTPDGAYFCINNPGIASIAESFGETARPGKGEWAGRTHYGFLRLQHLERRWNGRPGDGLLNIASHLLYAAYYHDLRDLRVEKMSLLSRHILDRYPCAETIETVTARSREIYEGVDRENFRFVFPEFRPGLVVIGVPLLADNRDDCVKRLRRKGIHCATFVRHWNFIPVGRSGEFENESQFRDRHILVPVSPYFSARDAAYIVSAMNECGKLRGNG